MGPSPQAALWRKAGTPFPGITLPSFALLLSALVWELSGSPSSLPAVPSPTAHLGQAVLAGGSLFLHPGSRLTVGFSLPLPLQFFDKMCRH